MLVAAAFCGQVIAQPANSQSPGTAVTPAQVKSWLDAEAKSAAEPYTFGQYSIAWRYEDLNALTPEEVAALRAEVAAHPEHPRLQELNTIDRQLRGEKITMSFEFFADGKDRFRYNLTAGNYFTDLVYVPGRSWSMNSQEVAVFDPVAAAQSSDERQAPLLMLPTIRADLDQMFHGGIGGFIGTLKLTMEEPLIEGDRWKMIGWSRPKGHEIRYEITGRWDHGDNRGFVESAFLVTRTFAPETVGTGHRFGDWKKDPAIGRWVAHRIEHVKPGNRVSRVAYFEGAKPFPAGGFDAVTRTPVEGGTDIIRGPVKATMFVDLNTGKGTEITPSGERKPLKVVPAERPASWLTLRTVGWVTLGVLLIAAIVLRVRGRSNAQV